MTTLRQALWQRLASPWWAGLVAAAVVMGCGGGDTSTAGNGVGTGGTGAAAGPVTGYGSLIVNNTRFDVETASFTEDDGTGLQPSDRVRPVGLGAIVDIRSGEITRNSDDDDVARATVVTVISAIKGPVESLPASNALTVLGQKVKVNSATQYGTTAGNGLSDLTVGMAVMVFGYQDDTGAYLATRIEQMSPAPLVYKLRGRVTSVSGNNFKMGEVSNGSGGLSGGITVDTRALDLNSLPQVGDTVGVRLGTSPISAGTYLAIRPMNTVDRTPVEASRTHLEGMVSLYASNSQGFKVDGVAVLITSSTQITGTLTNNRRASVDGVVRDRVLVATKIEVRDDSGDDLAQSYKLIDRISGLDVNANTFQLKSLTVRYDGSTRIEGCRTTSCSEADLANTVYVEVEGRPSGNGSGFVATRIRLRLPRG